MIYIIEAGKIRMNTQDIQDGFIRQKKVIRNSFLSIRNKVDMDIQNKTDTRNPAVFDQLNLIYSKSLVIEDHILTNIRCYFENIGFTYGVNIQENISFLISVLGSYKEDLQLCSKGISEKYKITLNQNDPIIKELEIIDDILNVIRQNHKLD